MMAIDKRKHSATIKNVRDNATWSKTNGVDDRVGDTTFIFDPARIRSRFAAFDPARAYESDLLASRLLPWATGGLMGYSLLNSDDSMASEGGSRRGLMGLFR